MRLRPCSEVLKNFKFGTFALDRVVYSLGQKRNSCFLCSRIGNSIISRNGHNRYQEIDHGLIFCEQGIKRVK